MANTPLFRRTFSDSVNLGSNPSSPATGNADVSGVSRAPGTAEQSAQAEQTAHTSRTEPGTAPDRVWTQDEIDNDMGLPFICPVTCQPCCTEENEFCEDYGCARRAGIDVDRDIV